MPTYPVDAVCRKLGINRDQINALFAAQGVAPDSGRPVAWDGNEVAKQIAIRFGIDYGEPLGQQLAAIGVLTQPEADYLDDLV